MNIKHTLLATLTAAVLGMTGMAQAHDRDDGHRDGDRHDRARVPYGWVIGRDGRRYQAPRHSDRRSDKRSDRHFDNRIDRQQTLQKKQIRQGLRSGDLTRGEARRLREMQQRIDDMERRFGADSEYTKRERRALREALEKSQRKIERATSNDKYAHRYDDRYKDDRYKDDRYKRDNRYWRPYNKGGFSYLWNHLDR